MDKILLNRFLNKKSTSSLRELDKFDLSETSAADKLTQVQVDELQRLAEATPDVLTDMIAITAIANSNGQGHYALLSSVYFGGVATVSRIETADINVWQDIILTVDANGTVDKRPKQMIDSGVVGHTGTGASGDPLIFNLEGLTVNGSCSVRTLMQFNPDADEGRLDNRVYVTRHSGTTPSADFNIETTSVAMESGANIEYANAPNVQFIIEDTIDTNAAGDAGTVKVQIKSDVAGTVTINEIALFIQS